jgi:RING-box protein 1
MAEKKKEVDVVAMEDGGGKEDTTTSSANTGVRFEIKKWNAVTMWSWDICADTCAICRNSLNEPSIEYQVIRGFEKKTS